MPKKTDIHTTKADTSRHLEAETLAIEFINLRKSFGEQEILKGIDIKIKKGEICVILGGSGMGKSVLMKHMIGLLQPTSGQVIINGTDINQLSSKELKDIRQQFGMVFQQAALFDSMSNYNNIAFPLREHKQMSPKELDDKVRSLMMMFSLDPDIIGPKTPSEISGGQRKRVGLARAVALEPSIVLYDEPTTGLDPITTDQVDEMIRRGKTELGITSVVISHDIASAFKIADQILFVYNGQIVAQGKQAEILTSEHHFVQKFFATYSQRELQPN